MPVWAVAIVLIALIFSAGLPTRLTSGGALDPAYRAPALFFSINLPICFREACLFGRHGSVERQAPCWREPRAAGLAVAIEFLTTVVRLPRVLPREREAGILSTESVREDASRRSLRRVLER